MHEATIVALIVPLISAFATIISVIISNRSSAKVQDAKYVAQMNELRKDLKRIETKLEEYNGLNVRMYEAEEQISVLEQRVKHCEEKLDKV